MANSDVSLYHIIQQEGQLTDEERTELYSLLGSGCQMHTKNRLWNRLGAISLIPCKGILRRLIVRPYVHYNAGQSYPDEIRTVREVILDRGR